jgi:hypothetical protein
VYTKQDLGDAVDKLETILEDFDLGVGGSRPVLSTGPAIDPFQTYTVLTWALMNDAAWLMEPRSDAFVAAVRWARPTVVMASAAEVEQLAAEMGERRTRKRWRLRAIVVLGRRATEKACQHWKALGVEIRHLAF